jgi:hypothetical protein
MLQRSWLRGVPVLILAVLVAGSSLSRAQDKDTKEPIAPPKPPELKVLNRFLGNWDTDVTSKKAEWNPKEFQSKGTSSFEWVLDGHFMKNVSKAVAPEKAESFQLITYNPAAKKYFMWFFDSTGAVSEAEGTWDAENATLTWTSMADEKLAVTNRIRFVDKDTIAWTMLIKDKDNKVYLDLRGKMTRKKE